MKLFLVLSAVLFAHLSLAEVSIPRGTSEDRLAKEVAELTGLEKSDARYPKALKKCAMQDSEVEGYFAELVTAFHSEEFANLSEKAKHEEITMVRIAIKMLCRGHIEAAGIDL